MPLNTISIARLREVHPLLEARIRNVVEQFDLYTEEWSLQISQGIRNWNLQKALYQQGRIPLEQVNRERTIVQLPPITAEQNVIVTNAPPGYSWHNFAMAVDFAIENRNGRLDWKAIDPNWTKLIALAAPNGLLSGATFLSCPDRPHMQLQEIPETPTDEDRQVFIDGGTLAVWEKYFPGGSQ